jgi:hypothetical protein
MTEQPRDWDKELADIDRAIAKQGGAPGSAPVPAGATPRRRFVALAWFWTLLAIVLAVALVIWPFDRTCGIRLIFFLGAVLVGLVLGVVGSFTSYAHRQGLALVLSLLVILLTGIMGVREVLPRTGYAKQAMDWTCPPPPPVPDPAPAPSQ